MAPDPPKSPESEPGSGPNPVLRSASRTRFFSQSRKLCQANATSVRTSRSYYGAQRKSVASLRERPLDVTKNASSSLFTLTVTIGTLLVYEDDAFNISGISDLFLQSHWGSGVLFSSMNVVRKN